MAVNLLTITKETNDYFTFVLNGDAVNAIKNTRNDLLTQGNFCHFKTSEGANLIKEQNIIYSNITIINGMSTLVPVSVDDLFVKLISVGFWDWLNGSVAGVDRFDELEDTFTYFGKDGQSLRVNESELKLETFTLPDVSYLDYFPSPLEPLKSIRVNSSGDGYEFYEPVNVITQTILAGNTLTAPSEDVVNAALALKANLSDVINPVWGNILGTLSSQTDLQNALDLKTENSAGAIQGFALTNNGDGTVNIASGIAFLRSTNNPYAALVKYPISGVNNLSLTDNANNFILVDYNSGSPALTVTTNAASINTTTNSIALVVSRVGTTLDWLSLVGQNVDANAKLRQRFLNQEGIRRANGAVIGFSNRNLTLTAGTLFSGLIPIISPAFNTASPDTFTYVYNNGSAWTRVTGQTQVSNTQYNNAGTLATMPNNTFRTDYVYLLPNNPSKLYVVYGTTTYANITLARTAPTPSSLPSELQVLGLLVGRQIIEKNATAISEVSSAFSDVFAASGVPEHNALAGLQGGAVNDYQHLTTSEKNDLNISFQTEITASSTVFDNTKKGNNKVFPFKSDSDQTLTINSGIYLENDVINIERRGLGNVEIIQGTSVRFRGVRTIDNRFFIGDPNTMVSLICRGSNIFSAVGNLKRGGSAVTTSYYSDLLFNDINKSVTVYGTGFSPNMIVTIAGNATQTSAFTYVSSNEITLHLTSTGSAGNAITVTYDNGDVFDDINAIILLSSSLNYVYTTYPFSFGYALFKLKASQKFGIQVRRDTDNSITDVRFDSSGKISLSSLVTTGATLATWAGSANVYIVTKYNQGSAGGGFNLTQSDATKQAKFLNAGALIVQGGRTFSEFDGTNDGYTTLSKDNWAAGNLHIFADVRSKSLANGLLCGYFPDSPRISERLLQFRYESTGIVRAVVSNEAGAGTNVDSGSAAINTNYNAVYSRNATNQIVYLNGTAGTSVAVLSTYPTEMRPIEHGCLIDGSSSIFLNGYNNYLIMYKIDNRSDITNIQNIINNYL